MPVKHIRGEELDSVTAVTDKISLVDFSASWCGPCKMLEPVLDKVSDEMDESVSFYHVDVDESPVESSKYGIRGVPTMIVFHGGDEIDRMVGFRDRNALQMHLTELADSKLK